MNHTPLWIIIGLILAVVLIVLGLLVPFGCHMFPSQPKPVIPTIPTVPPPVHQIIQKALNLPWLLSMSVFGIAGGVVGLLFLPGPLKTLALALITFCAVGLGLTLLVAEYAQWLVLGTVVGGVGIGIYGIYHAKNTHIIADQAIRELVKTVDLTKDKLTAEAKEHLFGIHKPVSEAGGVVHTVQSATTEAIVAEVRKLV